LCALCFLAEPVPARRGHAQLSQLIGVPSSPCLRATLPYRGFLLPDRARSVSSSLIVPSSPLHVVESLCLAMATVTPKICASFSVRPRQKNSGRSDTASTKSSVPAVVGCHRSPSHCVRQHRRFLCVLAQFPVRQRVLSARLALILIASSIPPVSVVRHRVACVALYKSPFYVVVVPCVIKKSQESDEDKASKRGVHQVRDKKLGHSA
jgi:hypothetical protein